ncbi:MAG: hypothetical protein ACI4QT_05065 [Kiritimatiellia bacterium]
MRLKSIGCVLAAVFFCCQGDSFANGCFLRNPPGLTDGEARPDCGCAAIVDDAANVA